MTEVEGWRPSAADLATIAQRIGVKLTSEAPHLFDQIAASSATVATPRAAAGRVYRYCVLTRPADDASGFLALELARVLLLLNGTQASRIDRTRADGLLADVESGVLTGDDEIGRRLQDL